MAEHSMEEIIIVKDQLINLINDLHKKTDLSSIDDIKRTYNYFDWINNK